MRSSDGHSVRPWGDLGHGRAVEIAGRPAHAVATRRLWAAAS